MDVMEVLRNRFSCRSYRTDPVSSDLLMQLVDAARLAPSSRGEQPWEFVLVTDVSTLKELSKRANTGPFIAQAAACIAVFCRADAKYAVEDGSAATQNILIAATALGLGSCWVAGDKKDYAASVSKLLRAPPEQRLISLISVGFPKAEAPADRKRRELADVLHWQHF